MANNAADTTRLEANTAAAFALAHRRTPHGAGSCSRIWQGRGRWWRHWRHQVYACIKNARRSSERLLVECEPVSSGIRIRVECQFLFGHSA